MASVRRVEGDSGGPEGSWGGRKEGRKTVVDGRKQGRTVVVRGEPHSPNDDDEQTHPCIQVWHFLVFYLFPPLHPSNPASHSAALRFLSFRRTSLQIPPSTLHLTHT